MVIFHRELFILAEWMTHPAQPLSLYIIYIYIYIDILNIYNDYIYTLLHIYILYVYVYITRLHYIYIYIYTYMFRHYIFQIHHGSLNHLQFPAASPVLHSPSPNRRQRWFKAYAEARSEEVRSDALPGIHWWLECL